MAVKQTLDNDEIEPDVQDRIGNLHNDLPGQKGKESNPPKNGGNGHNHFKFGQRPHNTKKDNKEFNNAQYKGV